MIKLARHKNDLKQYLHRIFLGLLILMPMTNLYSQDIKDASVLVDDNGTMRWESSNAEVTGFGVNYTVPFAHAYRTAKRLGIDPKKAIDNDVYHFTRLGFDLYRLHVWDTQISDDKGNLIENEYLDTFDYLLHKLKEKHINYVITPIAYWGNGWPEPDTPTPGFSYVYGKGDCLTNPEAIKAQKEYLFQFLNHINPYTGVAYKNEPNIIAFEVSNEPHHRGEASEVTAFVEGMITAMRNTGTQKPIFYNMSHAVHFADAYFEGGADGGTFQWYPTGLGYQQELQGNLLPNVDDYNIPFENSFKKYNGAKLVYEFDAADVGKSYIYPAMARSFRKAGIQIATHFAYDPTFMADVNTEYNTHYMNLAYTPQKALSLKICSEVFRKVPLYKNYGAYPNNSNFGDFSVDYDRDLATYNSEDKFFYTNNTNSQPKNEKKLTEIAGYGRSKLVDYDGFGAYFLDKIDKHTWRLEVMPDAVWVGNPFGRNSPDKTIGVINWLEHQMHLNLSDLGNQFTVKGINEGNTYAYQAIDGQFKIKPGTYMLYAPKSKSDWSIKDSFKGNTLNDFYAPATNVNTSWLLHNPIKEGSTTSPLKLTVQYVAPELPEEIRVIGHLGSEQFNLVMSSKDSYNYALDIPTDTLKEGYLKYYIVVKTNTEDYITYPASQSGQPNDWDFYDRRMYTTPVVESKNAIHLFNAYTDSERLVSQWRRGNELKPTASPNKSEYQIHLDTIFKKDNENLNAKPIYDYSVKHVVLDNIEGRRGDLKSKHKIVFEGRSLSKEPVTIQVALVLKNGSSYGGILTLEPHTIMDYSLDLNSLQHVKTVTLPRPYPSFLPYYFNHTNTNPFNLDTIESLQLSIGSEIINERENTSVAIGIVSIRLE